MEWGSFITTIIVVYTAWYGLNYLYDNFIAGKGKKAVTDTNVHYDMGDLIDEDHQGQVITEDFTTDTAQDDFQELVSEEEEEDSPVHVIAEQETSEQAEYEEESEEVKMNVQGQPVSVMDFLNSFKQEAKSEARLVFN